MNFSFVVNIMQPIINLIKPPEHEKCVIVQIKLEESLLALHFDSKQELLMFIKSLQVATGQE